MVRGFLQGVGVCFDDVEDADVVEALCSPPWRWRDYAGVLRFFDGSMPHAVYRWCRAILRLMREPSVCLVRTGICCFGGFTRYDGFGC